MIRVICLIGGLAGGAGLSQFPEFSQQYLQRLAGQVDALTVVVKDFDASALASGLGREQALEQMAGKPFLESRQADMRRTFARHARLSENLMILREASPLARLTLPHRMADGDTLGAVWADFTPAVPLSVAGAVSAGGGFVGGWAGFAAILAALGGIWGRLTRKTKTPPPARREPVVRIDPAQIGRPPLVAGPPGLTGTRR